MCSIGVCNLVKYHDVNKINKFWNTEWYQNIFLNDIIWVTYYLMIIQVTEISAITHLQYRHVCCLIEFKKKIKWKNIIASFRVFPKGSENTSNVLHRRTWQPPSYKTWYFKCSSHFTICRDMARYILNYNPEATYEAV